jgi:hypothetical protein
MELRAAHEASERVKSDDKPAQEKPAATATKKKTRTKTPKETKIKVYWGVFNQSMKRVATFEYSQRPLADKKAKELSESQKTQHFVQVVKEQFTV